MENLTGGTPPVRYLPCVVPCKLYFASGVSPKAYFSSLNFYRDPAVFPVTAVTPATRKAKDTQYGAILRHISSIPCDPALAAFLFLSKVWV